jgi:uncharacterized protein
MLIENEFKVDAPIDVVWAHLLEVEKVAPCMPGAELTETVDDRNWKGKVLMKFGPVTMSFAGSVTMTERDDAAHRVKLVAKGTEEKGKGAANATVTSWLEPSDGSTTARMQADITLTGAAAQLSRGLLPEISKKLTQQFADCLATTLAATPTPVATSDGSSEGSTAATRPEPDGPSTSQAIAAKPVGGIGLGLSAVWSIIVNFFKRLFGGGKRDTAST